MIFELKKNNSTKKENKINKFLESFSIEQLEKEIEKNSEEIHPDSDDEAAYGEQYTFLRTENETDCY